MIAEFKGACGGNIAIETSEIIYVYEVELLGTTVVKVEMKDGKSFLLQESFEDVLLWIR